MVKYGVAAVVMLFAASGAAWADETASELWPREKEISVARSAAPEAASAAAAVWVLTEDGYELAEEGANGFNCLVMRRWGAAFDTQKQIFETPGGVIAPICFDPKASGTPMNEQLMRAEMGVKGNSHDEIRDAVLAAYGDRSAFNGEAIGMLRELRRATASFGSLARMIERNPRAFILGR